MVDASMRVETGFFGEEQNAAATWTIRAPEIFGRLNRCRRLYSEQSLARGLNGHRRSSDVPLYPYPTMHSEWRLWRYRDGGVKLSWRRRNF
jgi:hypothetical protein